MSLLCECPFMENCKKCRKPFCSNGDCEECLEFLIQQEKGSIEEEDARRVGSSTCFMIY